MHPPMIPDLILAHPSYDLRSVSRLAARDDPWVPLWLHGLHPLFIIFRKLRNERAVNRKEFYETVFVLDRLAPELRRTRCLVEVAAGHGMLCLFSAVLYPRLEAAVAVDLRQPLAWDKVRERVSLLYPFVKMKTRFVERKVQKTLPVPPEALVVAIHGCGGLTDLVGDIAREAGASFAVAPCCEARNLLPEGLRKVVPGKELPQVLGDLRAERWRSWGYTVEERSLPESLTARGRLFVCHAPPRQSG